MSKVQTMDALFKRIEIYKQLEKSKKFFTQVRDVVIVADMDRFITHVEEVSIVAQALDCTGDVVRECEKLLNTLRQPSVKEGKGLNNSDTKLATGAMVALIDFIKLEISSIVK